MTPFNPVFSDGVVSLLTASRQDGDWDVYQGLIEYLKEHDVGVIPSDDGHILVFRTLEGE